jgi:hypothetical protein
MMWRFRLTRTSSFTKFIDELKENKKQNIHIHFSSGGQVNNIDFEYLEIINKLRFL